MKEEGPPSAQTTIEADLDVLVGFGDKRPVIYFLSGNLVGRKVHLLSRLSTVGRSSSSTITVADKHISREHFAVELDDKGALLRDMGSKNGTYVNGHRCETHRLQDGDKIQISSSTIMKFTLQDITDSRFHDQLYNMAIQDAVTNVYNRRHFLQRLDEAFQTALLDERALALIMLDLDHFKQVNDTFGHLAGDEVLRQVAACCKSQLRGDDLLARFGGEEFAVLLQDTEEERAVRVAERMRLAVSKQPIQYEDNSISVTMSLGVATHTPADPFEAPAELIREADTCLYISKENGRNRTTCSTDALHDTHTLATRPSPVREED